MNIEKYNKENWIVIDKNKDWDKMDFIEENKILSLLFDIKNCPFKGDNRYIILCKSLKLSEI